MDTVPLVCQADEFLVSTRGLNGNHIANTMGTSGACNCNPRTGHSANPLDSWPIIFDPQNDTNRARLAICMTNCYAQALKFYPKIASDLPVHHSTSKWLKILITRNWDHELF